MFSGFPIKPYTSTPSKPPRISSILLVKSRPRTAYIVFSIRPSPMVENRISPSQINLIDISGCDNAIFSTTDTMAMVSVISRFKNFIRAGVLKNSSSTITVVPSGQPTSSTETTVPPSLLSSVPVASSLCLVIIRSFDTEDIAASASPRKPRVKMLSRSFAVCSLLVAWRLSETGTSSRDMPQPLSLTRI